MPELTDETLSTLTWVIVGNFIIFVIIMFERFGVEVGMQIKKALRF